MEKGIRDLRSYGFVKQLSLRTENINQVQKLGLVQEIVSSHNAIKPEFNSENKKFLLPGYW